MLCCCAVCRPPVRGCCADRLRVHPGRPGNEAAKRSAFPDRSLMGSCPPLEEKKLQIALSVLTFVAHTTARGYGPGFAGVVPGGSGNIGVRLGGVGVGSISSGSTGIPGRPGGISSISGGQGGYIAGERRYVPGQGGSVPGVGRYAPGQGGYIPGAGAVPGYLDMTPKPFSFGYAYPDGQGGGQFKVEEGDGSGAVRGSYGYTDAQGLYRFVTYLADQSGFKADIQTNEPGVDGKENPADVTITAQQPPAGIQEQYTNTAVLGGGFAGIRGLPGSGITGGSSAVRGSTGRFTGSVTYGPSGFPGSARSQPGSIGGFPGVGGGVPGSVVDRFGTGFLSVLRNSGGASGISGSYPGSSTSNVGSISGPFSGIPLSTTGKSIH